MQINRISRTCCSKKTGTCVTLDLEPTEEPCVQHPVTEPQLSLHNHASTFHIKAERIIQMTKTEKNTSGYLHCQKGEVSKLLVETSNLVIMKPGLVVRGALGTTFKIGVQLVFLGGESAKMTAKHCFFLYLQTEVLHKPLVPQKIARHVRVSIIVQRPQTQRQQLQVSHLHAIKEEIVLKANGVTAEKTKGDQE